MDSPRLTEHNVGRLLDDLKACYNTAIPITSAMDCTVLKGGLSYCAEFGSHILGSVAPLDDVEVKTREDIDRIIKETVDKNLLASQVRVLIGKVSIWSPGFTFDPMYSTVGYLL